MAKVLPRVGWWNFTPVAVDLTVDCDQGSYVDIDLRKYLRQGANPPSERYNMEIDQHYRVQPIDYLQLRSKGEQRGFVHSLRVIQPPSSGTLLANISGYGLYRYTPNAGFFGEDSFDYCLATNWQSSIRQRITIRVAKKHQLRIRVYCHNLNDHLFRYAIEHDFTEAYVFATWYRLTPFLSHSKSVPEVLENLVYLAGYAYTYDISQKLVVFSDPALYSQWMLSDPWPDPLLNRQGYIEGTHTVYVQPDGPYPVIAQVNVATGPILIGNTMNGWANLQQFYIDVRSNGSDWWKNGMVAWVN